MVTLMVHVNEALVTVWLFSVYVSLLLFYSQILSDTSGNIHDIKIHLDDRLQFTTIQ